MQREGGAKRHRRAGVVAAAAFLLALAGCAGSSVETAASTTSTTSTTVATTPLTAVPVVGTRHAGVCGAASLPNASSTAGLQLLAIDVPLAHDPTLTGLLATAEANAAAGHKIRLDADVAQIKAEACVPAAAPATTSTVPATVPPTAAPTTVPTTTVRPATTVPSTTVAPSVTCSPTTPSGGCYRAGEYCPAADQGMTGTNASGAPIICENNNGLRWEPGS